ncbi:uncharacterized protein [Periplaneta americana]|uniref:uncharacterized protein isoform X3 n=1 Tax=Periplaneta americana TaxID=6978 RepID=UPI0037E8FF7C
MEIEVSENCELSCQLQHDCKTALKELIPNVTCYQEQDVKRNVDNAVSNADCFSEAIGIHSIKQEPITSFDECNENDHKQSTLTHMCSQSFFKENSELNTFEQKVKSEMLLEDSKSILKELVPLAPNNNMLREYGHSPDVQVKEEHAFHSSENSAERSYHDEENCRNRSVVCDISQEEITNDSNTSGTQHLSRLKKIRRRNNKQEINNSSIGIN